MTAEKAVRREKRHGFSLLTFFSERKPVGVYNGEGPPVPIPNTEVKLVSAENTWLETAREDRSSPTQIPADAGVI